MPEEREFTFQGYGMAATGFWGDQILPSHVICAIPPAGGSARTSQSDFRLNEIFAFQNAAVFATGSFDEKTHAWKSGVRVRLENCNLLDVVHVDRIRLSLQSTYPERGGPALRSALGTVFDGLRIAGTPVRVVLDLTLEQNGKPRRIPGSLATHVEADFPGVRTVGNRITIPQFGVLRIADATITPDDVQVTMLGADLEPPQRGGRIDLATARLSGNPYLLADKTSKDQPAFQKYSEEKLRMDEGELEEVLAELRLWASSHPNRTEPFLFFMGKTLSPVEFLGEVEGQSPIGVVFLNILVDQAGRSKQRPWQFIARAVEANRPR